MSTSIRLTDFKLLTLGQMDQGDLLQEKHFHGIHYSNNKADVNQVPVCDKPVAVCESCCVDWSCGRVENGLPRNDAIGERTLEFEGQVVFGRLRKQIGEILRELCRQRGVEWLRPV